MQKVPLREVGRILGWLEILKQYFNPGRRQSWDEDLLTVLDSTWLCRPEYESGYLQVWRARFYMIEVVLNDRLGKKVRVKCNEDDTVGDLKKLVAAQTGTRPEKIRIQKWYTIYKDHITLADYEIKEGMSLELYYN